MNAEDEVIHHQMHNLALMGRKSIQSDVCIVAIAFHDDNVDAQATLAAFNVSDEVLPRDEGYVVVDTLARALNNILKAHSSLKVIIRDEKTGKDYDVADGTFGHHVTETEPL